MKSIQYLSLSFVLIAVLAGCSSDDPTDLKVNSTLIQNIIEVPASGNENFISEAGTYTFSGIIPNGILVEASKEDDIVIVLNNVEITTSEAAPIYIKEAGNVTLLLAENSVNVITDNRSEKEGTDDFPNAAIYSMADLEITGLENSLLTVIADFNDGITSKDDLSIVSANVEVVADDDGIRGKDSLEFNESILTVISDGDALKSDNTDEGKGNIILENSAITIESGDDGIQAANVVEVRSGMIKILGSVEGIEGQKIIINGGTIDLVSSDDGLNVSANEANANSGKSGKNVLAGGELTINGGTVRINSEGDGFDSNGSASMTGGLLIIDGPTTSRNGPIDVNGEFVVTGGEIIAVGASGMAETPSAESSQLSLQVNTDVFQIAGTTVLLQDSLGAEVFQFTSLKEFQSVTYTSSKLTLGESYSYFINGEKYVDVTLEKTITTVGDVVQNQRGPRS